jgi:hydrogenase maturation protease
MGVGGDDTPVLTVAGIGSRLGQDDAIGLVLVEALPLADGVRAVLWEDADAMTVASELLSLPGPALLVDCAEMGLRAGEHQSYRGEELMLAPHSSASVHGLGLGEAIGVARELGLRHEVGLFGVQPFGLAPSLGLTAELAARVPALLVALCGEVALWRGRAVNGHSAREGLRA